MPAKRVCATVGCPHLIDRDQRRCPACAAKYEKQRGTRQARGYDQTHVDLRAQWAPIVTTGTVHCARCHQLINPHELWSLDHDDNDRTQYRGPSHRLCNDRAGGQATHKN